MLEQYYWPKLSYVQQERLLQRPGQRDAAKIEATVIKIVDEVRSYGDRSLREWTRRLDKVELENFRVENAELDDAWNRCDKEIAAALTQARENVACFHKQQLVESIALETVPGMRCERVMLPLTTVGLYVPGGNAPLPSSLIMQAVPARLAGCPRIALCTPPQSDGNADPTILAAARLCGIDEVYTIGGAQAIAALAFGTETVARVDKIFGPGNAYVAAAKQCVSRHGVACDLPAGPSEVMVVADEQANPAFVASDLLAQAEHGADSQVMLVTNDRAVANAVRAQLQMQLTSLPRAAVATAALAASCSIVVDDTNKAFDIVNRYAPEHLILQLNNPRRWLDRVQNAASVFLGPWTPEALGDYCSGANHVLPTGGLARANSGLGLADFQKAITVQEATAQGLRQLGPLAATLAGIEQLDAHARSVTIRLGQLDEYAA